MNILELSEQGIGHRQSPQELRNMGIDPYPAAEFPANAFGTDIKAGYQDGGEKQGVMIAGRMVTRRVMGKVSFVKLQGSKDRVQVYVTRDDIRSDGNKDLYNVVFKCLLDTGDITGIKDFMFKTQTGGIPVHVQSLTLLSKTLKSLSIVKYKDGVAYDKSDDPELRYRQRYVDLVVNDDVKDTSLQRATVLRTMRKALGEVGYTEVEAPILQAITDGANARPFVTCFDVLNIDTYMCATTELYLKRLVVSGFKGVYEIDKNFRNEGMDRNHNSEFTCMRLYMQYKNYGWMMASTKKLLEAIRIAVNGSTERETDGQMISLEAPCRRLSILDATKEKVGYDLSEKTKDEIRETRKKLNMEVDESMGKDKLIDEIFGELCEGTFIQPTLVTDYPVEMPPLTKMHRSKPGLTEHFELMVNGKELASAYSELNDPTDQEECFKEQMKLADKGDDEAMITDQDFLCTLQYGMPPISGIGIGIDRLVMLMTGKTFIQEMLFFPQVKPEKKIPQSTMEEWATIGVPELWVPVLRKVRYNLISDIVQAKAQALQMNVCGVGKKHKLGYDSPKVEQLQQWIDGGQK